MQTQTANEQTYDNSMPRPTKHTKKKAKRFSNIATKQAQQSTYQIGAGGSIIIDPDKITINGRRVDMHQCVDFNRDAKYTLVC